MARCFTLTVDGMTPAELRRAVAFEVDGRAATAGWHRMPGGRWVVDAFDPDDADAYEFEPTAEAIFEVHSTAADQAEVFVAKVVIAILQAEDINAWLGFEGTETLHRLNGKTSRANRDLWGDLADKLNEGLHPAA